MGRAFVYVGEQEALVRLHAGNFAKALNCAAHVEEAGFCGKCFSCKAFNNGNHPDVFYVTGSKQKGIGVQDVREQIILPMAVKPFSHKYRIFIVYNAENLTPAAQNALLKTIEEPAPYGVFLFAAPNTRNFLQTVISRCTVKKIAGNTEEIPISESGALAKYVADRIGEMDTYDAFMLYKRFESLAKDDLAEVLDLTYDLIGRGIAEKGEDLRERDEFLFNACAAVNKAKQVLAKNGNTQLTVELMLYEILNVKEVSARC